MDPNYLKNIKKGMKVTILTSNKKQSTGIVSEIAARTPYHEQGIMVRLENKDFGRVKKIILSEPEKEEASAEEVKKLLKNGESFKVEFKKEAFWSTTYSPQHIKESKSAEVKEYGQRASKVIIARSIAAFLNSEGGTLIIGIKEKPEKGEFEIYGIDEDMERIREPGIDSYKRTIIDEIIKTFFPPKIFNHLNDYFLFEFTKIDEKSLCIIKIKKSDSKVFLKINNKEIFMIRVDSENRTLEGERLVDYCIKKWKS